MMWRRMKEADIEECLAFAPARHGGELIGPTRALAAWKELIANDCCSSCVIERESPDGLRVDCFAVSVFVLPEFAERELAHPAPGLNARILGSIDRGKPVILNESQLKSGNTRGDLSIVVLAGNWRPELSTEEVREIHVRFSLAFVELHEGYRIRRLMTEALTRSDREYVESVPGWETVADFGGRCLVVMDREKARSIPGSVGSILFQNRTPILGLRPVEQELLAAVLKAGTDVEAAERLQLSVAAVKKRWAAIFERVAAVRPELIAQRAQKRTRGSQQRHRVIAYVREHPEELRPFDARLAAEPSSKRRGAG